MYLQASRAAALVAALAFASPVHGASLTFLEADWQPTRFATFLSPDGTLVTGYWVDPGGYSDHEGFRWTRSGETWTGSQGSGVQHPDQSFFTHNGVARTNELVYSQFAGEENRVWRSPGGGPGGTMVPLPASADPGCPHAMDTGAQISADGTAIVVGNGCGIYRWTAATGSEFITPAGIAGLLRISDDGLTVTGDTGVAQFLWTQAGGYAPLSIVPGFTLDVLSGDGSTVGGGAVVAGQVQALVWDAIHGTTFLGELPSGDDTRRLVDISEDGSVAVGAATLGFGLQQAFAWTRDEGAVGLGRSSRPVAMTPDGKLVVGYLLDASFGGDRVFVWDLETGVMRTLGEILESNGVDGAVAAALYGPVGISDDGRTIAGNSGYAPGNVPLGAWVAVIPEPGTASLVALGAAGLALRRVRASARGTEPRRLS